LFFANAIFFSGNRNYKDLEWFATWKKSPQKI
jgi:hypothetical protein